MKGQVSFEYALLIGAVLLVLIPLVYYGFSETSKSIRMNQANDAVKLVADTADTVFFLGPGSRKTVSVNLPDGIKLFNATNNEIIIKLNVYGSSLTDVFVNTKGPVNTSSNPMLPVSQGPHTIVLETLESGVVNVSYLR